MSEQSDQSLALIAERLKHVQAKQDETLEVIKDHVEEDRANFKDIDEMLRGRDSDNPGLFTRVDRVEGSQQRDKKKNQFYMSILGSVLATLIATIAITYFAGK